MGSSVAAIAAGTGTASPSEGSGTVVMRNQ
jgi:hypothetical protein